MNQRGMWQLILMAREGDRQAIEELFYSSFRPAYLILYAITADKRSSLDILAEGYVEVFQNLESLEKSSDFADMLNRFVIERAKALFPSQSQDLLRLEDGCEADAPDFRRSPPLIHDFDTLPALNLSARADDILSAFHALPLTQQVCAYLFYYTGMQPDTIADILASDENKVCGTLQRARQTVLPQIDAVLKKSTAFRGTDAESAIPWALRCSEQFVPLSDEADACRQTVLGKLASDEILDLSSQEEIEPEPEFEMQNIAPPKEHRVLHAIFSLPTLIGVLIVLIAVGSVVGIKQLHAYNIRRHNLENHTDRTTLTLTSTTFPSERYIFSTEMEAPTEPPTTTEPETEEPPATTEEPTATEPTTPVITTAAPHSEFAVVESGNTVTITGYSGSKTNVEVPSEIGGKTVTAIGENAFFNSSITSIKLPSSIHAIGKNAFHSCTSLGSISLPAAVTNIESNAFRSCTGLKAVTLPSSLKKIGSQAFYQCSSLASIALPKTLTSIGDWAFAYCTNLGTVAIPSAVSSIGSSVFYECKSLSKCTIESGTHLSALGDSMFFDCTSLKSFTIPSTVKAVPANCFVGCRSMTSVSLPSSITTIGQNAFADCISLTGIKFGSGLKKIESSAFNGCTGLKDITIPNGTTSIGESAFSGCTGLRTISIPASVTTIGNKAFYHCDDLVISCPSGSAAEKYADKNHIEVAGRTTSSSTYASDTTSE